MKSAANDMEQGRAIHKVNERWGDDYRKWQGRETIGIPVCKKKYAPFEFKKVFNKNGKVRIEVKRMYGCACHSNIREKVIRRAGERAGWEPFGQWSLKKAQSLANRLVDRMNRFNGDSSLSSSDSDEGGPNFSLDDLKLCHNGMCVWRYKHKYDDIMEEMET